MTNAAAANVNTTDIEVPVTMHIESEPKPIEENPDLPPVFKDEVRDSIFAKRRAQLEAESDHIPAFPEPEPIAATPEPEPEPEPVAAAANAQAEKEKREFELLVYGQTRKVSEDELISHAQKGMAASQMFEEAARMKNEAIQIANAVKQNLQPQQVAQNNAPAAPQQQNPTEAVKDIAKRINYGSEDEQAKALLDLGAIFKSEVGRSQGLPQEQIVQIATHNAIAAIKSEQEQAILKSEFADILADYPLSVATDMIANQLAVKYQNEGVQKSRLELFREAGNAARDRYIKPSQVSQPQNVPAQNQPPVQAATVNVSNDKIERKRAAPKSLEAANKVATEAPPSYGVGVSSVVNQMRKSRGQPVY